ncbi:uncharacterized protein [Asterias amurensis]|uniref:uncharacterized protein n=1 Tax=Asterias amurensis TaxID=7602 RepID=UPI003AB282A1
MAQTECPYAVWIALQKYTAIVESAYCTCPAGLQGYCKHVMSLLHYIVREVERGSNKSCTSKPQRWQQPHKKGTKVNHPDFVKNLTIRKVKGSFTSQQEKTPKVGRINFDPRALTNRRPKKLSNFNLKALANITNGKCGTLLYALRSAEELRVLDTPDLNDYSVYNEETVILVPSVPCIASDILETNVDICLSDFEDKLINRMQVDQSRVDHISTSTVEQRNCREWFEMRKGRITASNVHECIRKVDNHDKVSDRNTSFVGKVMGYGQVYQTQGMRWGIENEQKSIDNYIVLQKGKHDQLEVKSTGLHVSEGYPYIAGSPDALVSCQCCGRGCLEVKNPYSLRWVSITELAKIKTSCLEVTDDGKGIQLKRGHPYYAQTQCEMFVTNTKYCDFFVRTVCKTDNVHIERVTFDENFAAVMTKKCGIFFKSVILVELFCPSVKKVYDLKFVFTLLDRVVGNAIDIVESRLVKYTTGNPAESVQRTPWPASVAVDRSNHPPVHSENSRLASVTDH